MKDKLIWILIPIAAMVAGYIIYEDYIKDSSSEKQSAEFNTVTDTTSINPDLRRTKMYEDEWSAASGQERKIAADETFFGERIVKDTIKKTTALVEANVPPEEKPKVIIKYVTEKKKEDPVAVIEEPKKKNRSRDSGPVEVTGEQSQAAIPGTEISVEAVVHNDQKIQPNGTLLLRLSESVKINGKTIPRNTFVSGSVSLQGERIMITVNNIKLSDIEVVKVNLHAYDAVNGGEGIFVAGGVDSQIKQDAASTVISEASRSIKVPIVDRVLPRAGQSKVYEQAVNVPSGIRVILKQ